MNELFQTPSKNYVLEADEFTCHKFGLAEFFASSFREKPTGIGANALDVGCGVGPISIFLADQIKCHVLGIELNGLACRNCRKNFQKYLCPAAAYLIEMDFSGFEQHQPSATFELIVSNPPITRMPLHERNRVSLKSAYENPDAESFAFLTNWWCDEAGRDLADIIFDYSTRHLDPNGVVAITFCEIDGATPPFVLSKASRFGFEPYRIVSGEITAGSIGANHLGSNRIPAHYIAFKKMGDDHGHQNCKGI